MSWHWEVMCCLIKHASIDCRELKQTYKKMGREDKEMTSDVSSPIEGGIGNRVGHGYDMRGILCCGIREKVPPVQTVTVHASMAVALRNILVTNWIP